MWNKINPWNTERRRLSWFCCFLLELYFNLSLVASANNFRKIKELPLLSLESYVEQTLKWTGFMEIYTPVPSWASHYRNSFTSIRPQYRRFPVRKLSLSKRGAKCKTFLVKMSSICMRILHENFHINGLALSLALKQRLRAIRKWPGQKVYHQSYFNSYVEPFIFHPWTWSWFLYLFVCIFFLPSLGAKYELIISRLVCSRKNPRIWKTYILMDCFDQSYSWHCNF